MPSGLLHRVTIRLPRRERCDYIFLALVAGSPALSGFEKVKGDELDREFLLKELLEPVPALGLVTLNAYACARIFSQSGYRRLADSQLPGVD